MRKYIISTGAKSAAVCKHKEVSWASIAKVLSTLKVGGSKDENGWLVGGQFKGDYRNDENLLYRSLLTLDVDEYEGDLTDLEFDLSMFTFNYVVYSTWRSTADVMRFRIVVPLSRNVSGDEYEDLANKFMRDYPQFTFDDCSSTAPQFMYKPCVKTLDGAFTFSESSLGEFQVTDDSFFTEEELSQGLMRVEDSIDDALELAVAHEPLDISDAEVDAYLAAMPAEGLEYDEWFRVLQGVRHQYRGSDKGYHKLYDWTALNPTQTDAQLKQIEYKYKTIRQVRNPVTFASVIRMVRDSGADIGAAMVESVCADLDAGGGVYTDAQFEELKSKLVKLPLHVVPQTKRQQIAQEIFNTWGKAVGVTKAAIASELMPRKRGLTTTVEAPSWLDGWVYVESTCEFANLDLGYPIRKEAFNAKYDREVECLIEKRTAASMALTDWRLQTVVDMMYWPRGESIFVMNGKTMANLYTRQGVAPYEPDVDAGEVGIDEDGARAIELFVAHVKHILVDESEQDILLDWLCHVVRNEGERVQWALLLQGVDGCGKSYFVKVLEECLGGNVNKVDASTIQERFTGWAYGSTVNVVEEIRVAGSNRWEVMDKMKPFITNDTIQIEQKGRDHRTVPNFCSYFLLTNHQDAIPITGNDRRYGILYSRFQTEAQLFKHFGGAEGVEAYFAELFSETLRRIDAIAWYLCSGREISAAFNCKGRAPVTSSRGMMIDYGVSHDLEIVRDAIAHHSCYLINERVVDVSLLRKKHEEDLFGSGNGDGDKLPVTNTLKRIMLELGYQKLPNRISKMINGVRIQSVIWHKSEVDEVEILDRFEKMYVEKMDIPF